MLTKIKIDLDEANLELGLDVYVDMYIDRKYNFKNHSEITDIIHNTLFVLIKLPFIIWWSFNANQDS